MTALYPEEKAGASGITSRNATRVNLVITAPGGKPQRVGRVQSINRSVNNNVQVLRELGAQVLVELKKGITEYTFSIAKMWIRNDVFDELEQGAIFELQTQDESANTPLNTAGQTEILDVFKQCAFNTLDRQYAAGQATIMASGTVVVIGQPSSGVLNES